MSETPITLYAHKFRSRAERVIWTLEELELDYRLIRLDAAKGDLQAAEFLSLNPAAKIPVVPPQNPVNGAIVDVSVLGAKLAYPDASPAVRPARDHQIEPEAAARTRSRDPRLATAAGHCAPSDISPRNTSLS